MIYAVKRSTDICIFVRVKEIDSGSAEQHVTSTQHFTGGSEIDISRDIPTDICYRLQVVCRVYG